MIDIAIVPKAVNGGGGGWGDGGWEGGVCIPAIFPCAHITQVILVTRIQAHILSILEVNLMCFPRSRFTKLTVGEKIPGLRPGSLG